MRHAESLWKRSIGESCKESDLKQRIRIREHSQVYLKKDYWLISSEHYRRRYLRLEKCARIVNGLAGSRVVDLLDVGCGPATLRKLLRANVH